MTSPQPEDQEQGGPVGVIVVGLHGIGLRVVEQLRVVGAQVVVVDDGADDRSVHQIETWRIGHIVGNPARAETLVAAGIDTAASIVCLENNELRTLEVALLARELNPRIRVVVRSMTESVGRAIAEVTGVGTVLDAGSLSAPAIVDAVLRRSDFAFKAGGQEFRVREVAAPGSGTLRSLYGDVVPIAAAGVDDVLACPGRDERVAAGDLVWLLGTPEQLHDHGVRPSANRLSLPTTPRGARYARPTRRPDTGSGSFRSMWRYLFFGADRALKSTVAALVILTVIASIVIDIGYVDDGDPNMDAVDSVYTTVQTLVTVGYGDFPFGDQPTYLRIFDVVLMLVGAALIAILFAQLTDLLVSRRIASTYGLARAANMRRHIVMVGLGSVGIRVVEQLAREGHQCAVIDDAPSARYLATARTLRVPVVVGDATDPAILAAANLRAASAVALVTDDDMANIEAGLAVREELGDRRAGVPTVLRLFDRQLSSTVERAFGFRDVRSTAALAAPWFVAAALGLEVTTTLIAGGEVFMVGRLRITSGGQLAGLSMHELNARVRIVAIERASGQRLIHPPRRDTILAPGDHSYLIGPHEELLAVLFRNQVR
ncbi:MAG: hypothetical protein QG597_3143 [Actinomycetota bacterium]|nr:hypothetical protein [Actinomycetota bacterium]